MTKKKTLIPLELQKASVGLTFFKILERFFHILSIVITAICLFLIITSGLLLWVLMVFFS